MAWKIALLGVDLLCGLVAFGLEVTLLHSFDGDDDEGGHGGGGGSGSGDLDLATGPQKVWTEGVDGRCGHKY